MSSISRSLIVCLVWLCSTSVGCRSILNYPVDRVKDLGDVVGLDFYWGQGVIAHAQATKVAQVGLGSFDGDILKYHHRVLGVVEEMRAEAGFPFYYFTIYDRNPHANASEAFLKQQMSGLGEVHYSLMDQHDRGFYEIGGTLVAFIGVGVSLDLYQALDFATGWLGFDLGRDDDRNSNRAPVRNPRYRSTSEKPVSEGMRVISTETESTETEEGEIE